MVMYIKVKLINCIDGTNPIGSFMSFHWFDFCAPEWIHGYTVFEKTTNPWEKVFSPLVHTRVHSIMHKNNPDLFVFHQLIHLIPAFSDNRSSVCINYDGIS